MLTKLTTWGWINWDNVCYVSLCTPDFELKEHYFVGFVGDDSAKFDVDSPEGRAIAQHLAGEDSGLLQAARAALVVLDLDARHDATVQPIYQQLKDAIAAVESYQE